MLKNEVTKSLKVVLEEKGMNFTNDQITVLHDAVFENLGNILADGNEVSIINFGTFRSNSSKRHDIHKREKENVVSTIQVFILKFKVARQLKDRLNGKTTQSK